MDAMVLAKTTLAELTGILSDPSKRPLAALGELVQLLAEVPAGVPTGKSLVL